MACKAKIRRQLPSETACQAQGSQEEGCLGEHQVSQEAEEHGEVWDYWGFRRKEWARQGKQTEDWELG